MDLHPSAGTYPGPATIPAEPGRLAGPDGTVLNLPFLLTYSEDSDPGLSLWETPGEPYPMVNLTSVPASRAGSLSLLLAGQIQAAQVRDWYRSGVVTLYRPNDAMAHVATGSIRVAPIEMAGITDPQVILTVTSWREVRP